MDELVVPNDLNISLASGKRIEGAFKRRYHIVYAFL